MCTAIKYLSNNLYFGRTLDNDLSYKEEIVITPRRRKLSFREMGTIPAHNAILGVAFVVDGFPLYYDACNDRGLAMAGLNYVGNAVFGKSECGKDNIATFEFIPWILCQCSTVEEAKKLLSRINITSAPFNEQLPASQLHWMIADKDCAVVVECDKDGMHVYDNHVGVLTNNPPFPMQLTWLNNYLAVSPKPPSVGFSDKIKFDMYSRGMGGLGLPGDLSSSSRFVRAAFTMLNSPTYDNTEQSVNQFFHILGAVDQTRGCCIMDNGHCEVTIYTTCFDVTKGVLYYTSYDNRQISAVDMNKVNTEGTALIRFPMIKDSHILMQN
ncbi:MAG: choloylglycine hydrolase [Clostridiales bacterium]|nr:choloylglycine hydrolase [Clostridiales bacterium]